MVNLRTTTFFNNSPATIQQKVTASNYRKEEPGNTLVQSLLKIKIQTDQHRSPEEKTHFRHQKFLVGWKTSARNGTDAVNPASGRGMTGDPTSPFQFCSVHFLQLRKS